MGLCLPGPSASSPCQNCVAFYGRRTSVVWIRHVSFPGMIRRGTLGRLHCPALTEDAAVHVPARVFQRCVSCPSGRCLAVELLDPGRTLRSTLGELLDCSCTGEHVPSSGVRAATRPQPQVLVRLADDCSSAGREAESRCGFRLRLPSD